MLTETPDAGRRARFRTWRSTRPFWGGVFLTASGCMLLLPALATVKVGDLLISISTIAGVSTLLLGSMMLVCAFSVLVRAEARIPAGVAAMVLALVALPAANFGGYVLGSLFGVFGSAATLAWASAK
ncbi:DUF6114 domain-containing protein [Rhodococcoides fascians]|uniref:Uncharacterized protein n=1 Tax=Rhodococcoides fascians TaxID=1828 RepID=A0A143QLN1_RHOFA|nr:DUF6114 domain-containing protein [Rhodococcus fascians]AMY23382.1 hypothetical protein A3Q41_02080 [Rhodococcus fascians]